MASGMGFKLCDQSECSLVDLGNVIEFRITKPKALILETHFTKEVFLDLLEIFDTFNRNILERKSKPTDGDGN